MGGIVTITVVVIIVTGILGNILAETICRLCKIEDPIAKGLAIGTSAHALGTAKAMELGEIEGAMSSLSIVVCGILTVISVSILQTSSSIEKNILHILTSHRTEGIKRRLTA